MKKFLILFITTITLSISAQESVVLRYNYQEGDNYEIMMKMTQEMGAVMVQTINTIMSQKTVSVKGDTIVNESKVIKMVMDMVQGGQTMSYDSSKKDDELDEMGKMMKTQMSPILSSVITSKSSSLGNLLGVTLEPNNPQLAQMFSQNSSVEYPKEAVKAGTKWSSTKDENGVIMKIDYTVKSISDKEVILVVSGDISGLAAGTITGDMTIDKVSGVPLKSSLKMKMNIQGQEMHMGVEGFYRKI